jgi:hypothetical protein
VVRESIRPGLVGRDDRADLALGCSFRSTCRYQRNDLPMPSRVDSGWFLGLRRTPTYHSSMQGGNRLLETPPLRAFGSKTEVCRLEAREQDETEREVIGSTSCVRSNCRVQGWGLRNCIVIRDVPIPPVEAMDYVGLTQMLCPSLCRTTSRRCNRTA